MPIETAQTLAHSASIRLPFGCDDLNPVIFSQPGEPSRVRCYVQGCEHFLQTPGRHRKGDVCPVHGIRFHNPLNPTYTFANVRRNIIASPDVFASRILRNPFKYESHRFGFERSEDAVSWNVFRTLYEARLLEKLGEHITGMRAAIEPRLYLWGLEVTGDAFDPWSLLIAARERFETNLPVERPKTEPDIALHLPGKYLILIEAKFTSPNTVYERGRRKDKSSLTMDELIGIYRDNALAILNLARATRANRIHYQLWRNTVFAEWMARLDHPATKAFHVSLVRDGYELDSAAEFRQLLNPGRQDQFQRLTWEQIDQLVRNEPGVHLMRRYLATKTAGLVPAFNLARTTR